MLPDNDKNTTTTTTTTTTAVTLKCSLVAESNKPKKCIIRRIRIIAQTAIFSWSPTPMVHSASLVPSTFFCKNKKYIQYQIQLQL